MKTFRQLINLLEVMTAQQHGADVYGHAVRKGMNMAQAYELGQKAEERRKQRFENIKNLNTSLSDKQKKIMTKIDDAYPDFTEIEQHSKKEGKKQYHSGILASDAHSQLDDLTGTDYANDTTRLRALISQATNHGYGPPRGGLHPSKIDNIANPPIDSDLTYHWWSGKLPAMGYTPITNKTHFYNTLDKVKSAATGERGMRKKYISYLRNNPPTWRY